MTTVDISDWITTEEACSIAKISVRTFKRYVAAGTAPQPFRVGRATRYSERSVTEWARHHQYNARRPRKAAPADELLVGVD
jgi:predicted DNA-binding transcriptional regulator AlpA